MTGRTVTLRELGDAEGTRRLHASLTDEGDLRIEGHDMGPGVERIYGYQEYEWVWTIRAGDLPTLLRALDVTGDVLSALNDRFSGENAAGLKQFLDSNEIPHESWSRIGD